MYDRSAAAIFADYPSALVVPSIYQPMDDKSVSIAFALVLLMRSLAISLAIPKSNFTDESALLAFKAHITSDPYKLITGNWSSATSICHWFGVTCRTSRRRTPRVKALDLSGMLLRGTIPPQLGNLSFLVYVDLSDNRFHGELPDELGRLRRLRYMDAENNRFSGGIPSRFGFLHKLQHLSLSSNSLTGPIPPSLFNITSLKTLDLWENFLVGNISDKIGNLFNLNELILGYNNLSGYIPPVIFSMPSLQIISLNNNELSGSLPVDLCSNHSVLEWLNLAENQLHGQIPSNLHKCTELRDLGLDVNKFRGSIPREIGNLTYLEALFLGRNNLEGKIPEEIAYLVSLQLLGLDANNLRGSIPRDFFQNLTLLQEIYLHTNNLTGSIPREVGNCSWLEEIHMSLNHLTGSIPQEIGKLHNLRDLRLAVNSFDSGTFPLTILNISKMAVIDLTTNNLYGPLPSEMGDLIPNLENLSIGGNQLSGTIPTSICNASKLSELHMSENSFSGLIPDCLGNLGELQRLNLHSNFLTNKLSASSDLSFLAALAANCRNLTYLAIDNNLLKGSLPRSIGNLSSLQFFTASYSRIKGRIPGEITNLSSLITLGLRNNEFSGPIPPSVGRLTNLQMLELTGNKLEETLPWGLCRLENLAYLYLPGNKLFGSIPACLSNLTSLRELDLSSNTLTKAIPSNFARLHDVLIVYLSSNLLTGAIPPEIGNLRVVTEMDLSMNQLSGDIPASIGEMKDLSTLSLNGNRLRGQISQSFGDLVSLEVLDLSSNNLSGQIPESLQKLSYLKYFNVSFNQLQGQVPDGGPFANFSAKYFIGNKALCGPSRLQLPPCPGIPSKKNRKLVLRYILPTVASVVLVFALILLFIRYRKAKAKLPTQGDLVQLASWRRISYHELERATDGFGENSLLGTGSFGSVYKGTLSDGESIAVKVFNLEQEEAFKSFDRESEVLKNLRHRNLVKIISCCCNLDFKALVLEFMPNGSLDMWLYSQDHFLDILQRLTIMIDVASALEYLHQGYTSPVVHCDLKPSNVLLDEDMVAHVADFGIAKLLGEDDSITHTLTLATVGYMAPEYGSDGIVSTRGDVYTFGILLMEAFTRKKPTNEMFVGEMRLKEWIMGLLPHALAEVIDSTLLMEDDEQFIAKKECITSIMALAFECAADSPEQRMVMGDVLAALKKIKVKFTKDVERIRLQLRRNRRSRLHS